MDKSILIVAAERGLGLGMAHKFFARGWHVFGTAREGGELDALRRAGEADRARLETGTVDVTEAAQVASLKQQLGSRRFDVIFMNAGIWGPLHQSSREVTPQEVANLMMTNTFGPIRLARQLLEAHLKPRGTLAFMSSHRASIGLNREGGLELYRASKVALNMLARGLHAENAASGLTVLSIHPGWVRTAMGTLDGTVEAEIEVEPSVEGILQVVERHAGSGDNRYLDYQGAALPW
ncbi:SDR family NAD(P)-dependent oxidoreductase [Xylophilus rhododendri]|uniref:SDR family NAD(P)-dependent oxidoreductase n=1 Tax=Xylophilus rhododendri TaxID=2697032 RepID=A0A857J354_9BURK|nr:SDR family NAD(P)-dependent oxidoreductase [Xylophilus rhododendri]QHI97482.1 SDR family NAD(P)-dependent oxidoreductase [Xylophilus rhododendri]